MNRWKTAFWLAAAVLVVSNLFWLYIALDAGISQTYLEASYDEQQKASADLGSLVVKGATKYSRKDVLHMLRRAKPSAFIVEEGDKIIFEGIVFRFESDRLVEVGGAQ